MSDSLNPKAVFESYVRAVNAGDLKAVMELFDDSVVTVDAIRTAFDGATAKESLRTYIGTTVISTNAHIDVERIAVSEDGWAFGELSLNSDMTREFGQERILGIDRIEVRDGRIVQFVFLPNLFDQATYDYYAALGLYSPTTAA